jgi:hypothetical protein
LTLQFSPLANGPNCDQSAISINITEAKHSNNFTLGAVGRDSHYMAGAAQLLDPGKNL